MVNQLDMDKWAHVQEQTDSLLEGIVYGHGNCWFYQKVFFGFENLQEIEAVTAALRDGWLAPGPRAYGRINEAEKAGFLYVEAEKMVV